MQPDLGETIIWGPVVLAMLFIGGLPLRYIICIVLIVLAFIPIAYIGLKPYQQDRITAFLASRYRQTRFGLGHQSIAYRHRVGRMGRQRFQGAKHADRARFSAFYCCA